MTAGAEDMVADDANWKPSVAEASNIVSVIIPVFNAASHLPRLLTSLVSQSYTGLQIIVVDDGSTDNSRPVATEWAQQDERIELLAQRNRGVSAARNLGLDHATGEFVSFIDADDWMEPDSYEVLVGAAQADPAIDVVVFGYFVNTDHVERVHRTADRFLGRQPAAVALEMTLSTPNRFACSRLFRRSVIGDARFAEDLHWGEDTMFVYEVTRLARMVEIRGEVLYHYYQSAGSATRSGFNPKRLSGVAMADRLLAMTEADYPELAGYVRSSRIGMLTELVGELDTERRRIGAIERGLRRELLAGVWRELGSAQMKNKRKLKGVAVALAPRLLSTRQSGGQRR